MYPGFQKSELLLYNCETAEVDCVFAYENGAIRNN